MKGIQINNFFNNHISLNNKKNNSKQPNIFFDGDAPQPIVFNRNQEDLDEIHSYEALTPQMKDFKKDTDFPHRKKKTNTIDPTHSKNKQNRKSKGKKSKSYEKFTKTMSLDKGNQKHTDQENSINKEISKTYKKQKTSRNKNQSHQPQGVRRSKSAIIKNTNPKKIESKQLSKQFIKTQKKNIISADSSFKNAFKKQLSKQTQNLLKKKQQTEKVQCKTARVQSIKINSRQNKDKIIGQLHKSAQKSDKKSLKYQTQKKLTGFTSSKSYLTTAKNSKPNSARDRKPSKKLFENKQKELQKNQLQKHLYKNLNDLMKNTEDQGNQQVEQALNELQSVLQGVSSKKGLAKQLKKFTLKLANIHSEENSQSNKSHSEDESNIEAFKKIKDFKNNLVRKKLDEAKDPNQLHDIKQKETARKKSSKKLMTKTKRLEDPEDNKKNQKQIIFSQNDHDNMESFNAQQQISQPQFLRNTQEEQSKYINSRNVSQLYTKPLDSNQSDHHEIQQSQEEIFKEVLDQRNKKYMQFLKSLEVQNNHAVFSNNQRRQSQQQNNTEKQKSEDQIEDINAFFNRQNFLNSRNYNSQNSKVPKDDEKIINPLLERKRAQGFQFSVLQNSQEAIFNHASQSGQISNGNISNQYDQMQVQIEDLKAFQQQSDKLMEKISNRNSQQKKKNLTIQLSQNSSDRNPSPKQLKKPLSPKYDDRYPHLVKSPKFSDIQITNILAAKQKCLASRHEKMNQLVQRMYQKELVSPKSYEYYVYQLKKQFEEESEGIDGFKQHASSILNEINKEKDDIKAIDELIRQQKWEQARKLMKGDQRAPSVFFGFKKNKQKVFQNFGSQQIIELVHKTQAITPSKKQNIGMIHNSISVTIKPQPSYKKQINEVEIEKELKKIRQTANKVNEKIIHNQQKKQKGVLTREEKKVKFSDSQSDLQNSGLNADSITKSLDFQFDQKFRLRSNDDLNSIIARLPKDNGTSQVEDYLQTEKADSEGFDNYVYYQSEEAEQIIEKIEEDSVQQQAPKRNQQLKQQGMFKLIEVSELSNQEIQQSEEKQVPKSNEDERLLSQGRMVSGAIQKKVIQIDEDDLKDNLVDEKEEQNNGIPQIEQSGLPKTSNVKEEKDEDSSSDSHSLIQLELRKGFQSNLFFIKEYCISLCEYIRDNPEVKNNFKSIISQPLQFDTLNLLKKYRTSSTGQQDNTYNSALVPLQYKTELRKPPTKAISTQLANEFNKTYGPLKFWNLDLEKKGRSKFSMEKQTEAIFLSAILEVLNESLDFQRPGSIFGKPLAWANKSKHLKNMKYLNGQKNKKVSEDCDESAETYDFIFGVAIARIIQWGSCLCGFLPDTAELQNTEIDDDYVVHIRETRMAFLLQKMLAEQEATFNNSQLEETEIMLYLGKAIAEQLVDEASSQIAKIQNFSFNLY